jgi:hypothetical protein
VTNTILISGDSWGCGEWGGDITNPRFPDREHGISHLGIEQYLIDHGYTVKNIAKAGVGNKVSIDILSTYIKKRYDYIFWFQSDPLRDVRDIKNKFTDFNELVKIQQFMLEISYRRLNNFNVPIYCIGGCSKIDSNLISAYRNLIPIIPSVTELLIPGYQHPDIWFSYPWFKELDSRVSSHTLDKLLEQWNIFDKLKDSKYFQIEAGHPDREGHLVIFNYLKKVLKL